MARMFGEGVLPESVNARRRQLRNRLQDLRDPVRNFREENIPGPDVIGSLEGSLMNLRTSVVERDSVLSGVRDRLGQGMAQESQNGETQTKEKSGNNGSSNVSSMT